ncbi:alpha/beta hydrolase [Enterovibrio norvegicus]|uniref:alpha/beta hydrolase n=1 Tax=Enterovibrio norvegicus TaxID=188144 RepID=UPI0013D2BDC8|nr:alpha/beta fold hydrolase [Enterovibrio norvegicus]
MKKVGCLLCALFAVALGAFWLLGSKLSSPANQTVHLPADAPTAENVTIETISAWYFPVEARKACVLLLHGNRGSKRDMVERAKFLTAHGFAALAIDFQAHGETPGEHLSYGYRESHNAHSAVRYLKETKACQQIAALGVSLGGAAAILGERAVPVDAYVLESVYSSIEQAVENRLALYSRHFPSALAPLLYEQIPLRLGVELHQLQPAEAVKHLNAPVLFIQGDKDKRTFLYEVLMLFDNAPEPKYLNVMEGAAHVDLHRFNTEQYETTVLSFLAEHLDQPPQKRSTP